MFRFLIASSFILGVMFVSCKERSSNETQETEVASETPTDLSETNTISIDTFNAWITRWDNTYQGYMDSSAMQYFDMPIVDLKEVLSENATGSRFYMGMEELSTGHYTPHIMLVGLIRGAVDSTNIFDYSNACPPKCN